MRTIDVLVYADGSQRPHLVEIEGPINNRGAPGRATLYDSDVIKHQITERLAAINAMNPWESPSKERRRARERRLGALINTLSVERWLYT